MDDELNLNTDNSDDYIILNNTVYRKVSSDPGSETSDGSELSDNIDENYSGNTYLVKSDSTDTDIIEYIQENTESIVLLQEDLNTFFQSQELMIKGIIILLLGFIVISVVRKTFDIFM